MTKFNIAAWIGLAVAAGPGSAATATVLEFDDKPAWAAAVGAFATVDFAGFASGTIITTQYATLGVALTDGNDMVVCCGEETFPQDGAGLDGNGNITVVFDAPQSWIAVDFPGSMRFQLFSAGQLFYTSSLFIGGGVGNFAGLVSGQPFDRAVLMGGTQAEVDDLHFGAPVPGPPAIGLLALGPLATARGRRRGRAVGASRRTGPRCLESGALLAGVCMLVWAARPTVAQTACHAEKLLAPDPGQQDEFGSAVAVRDDLIVVGTRRDDESATNQGSAYVFRFNPVTSAWLLDQKLLLGDGALSDWFGYAVAVGADRVVVGAPYRDEGGTDTGAAYVYRDTKGGWVLEQEILAPDAAAGDDFGYALAIDEGTPARIIVAAPFDDDLGFNAGSAYVFRFDDPAWVLEQKLLPADGAMLDNFGVSVAIVAGPPPRIIAGAYNDDDQGYDSGSVYVFRFDAQTSRWVEEQKLLAPDGEPDDQFGSSVSLSGATALIGCAWDDDKGENAGAAHVFEFDGSAWVQQQKLVADDGQPLDFFGLSVAISGHTAVIGASLDDDNGNLSGSAYVFGFDGSSWVQHQKLLRPGGFLTEEFGSAVAISGDGWGSRIVIGALWAHEVILFQGAVHVYNVAPGPGDLDCDGTISVTDLLDLLTAWGPCAGCPADLDGDGSVGIIDFLTLLRAWGP